MGKVQDAANSPQKKRENIADLIDHNEFLIQKQVGVNSRLQQPAKRIVENLLKLGVNKHIVAVACGLSYSAVLYYSRKIRTGSGRAGKAK